MSTPWSSVERPGSTQHQSGRRSEPSEAHGGLDRLDAKLRMRGWCQGRLCRRAAVDRPLTPAPQPNTTIQAIKTDTHDPARHLMVATFYVHASPQCPHTPVISITRALGVKPTARAAACRVSATDAEEASPTAPQRSQMRKTVAASPWSPMQ